jgi:hypothetical protein
MIQRGTRRLAASYGESGHPLEARPSKCIHLFICPRQHDHLPMGVPRFLVTAGMYQTEWCARRSNTPMGRSGRRRRNRSPLMHTNVYSFVCLLIYLFPCRQREIPRVNKPFLCARKQGNLRIKSTFLPQLGFSRRTNLSWTEGTSQSFQLLSEEPRF